MLQARSSIPDEVIVFYNSCNPYSRTTALGSTQPMFEISTRNHPGGVKGGRRLKLKISLPSLRRLFAKLFRASMSHIPVGLRGMLQGELLFELLCGLIET
jgi:hypothetical protein